MKRRWQVRVEFKPQDCWVGAYWQSKKYGIHTERPKLWHMLDLWVCLIPMVPIHVKTWKRQS